MFRNLKLYTFENLPPLEAIEAALAERPLKPVEPSQFSSAGWVPPVAGDDRMALPAGAVQALLLCLGSEEKAIPPGAVNLEVDRRMAKLPEEQRTGGVRRALKEAVVGEAVAKALPRPRRTMGYLDLEAKYLVVDASADARADAFVGHLVGTLAGAMKDAKLGMVALRNRHAGVPPGIALRTLLRSGSRDLEGDQRLVVESFAQLDDTGGARVRLDGGAIVSEAEPLLDAGYIVRRLGLNNGRASFVLGDDVVVRKFQLLDVVLEAMSGQDVGEDRAAEVQARLALLVLEVRLLVRQVARLFNITDLGS